MLALLALLAIGVAVWGLTRKPCDTCNARQYHPSTAMKGLGHVFSVARPKVRLPKLRYELRQGQSMEVSIAPWDGRMRMLELHQQQGVVSLRMNIVRRPDDGDIDEQQGPQTLPRTTDDPDDEHRLVFAVTGGGGRLMLQCLAGACVVEAR